MRDLGDVVGRPGRQSRGSHAGGQSTGPAGAPSAGEGLQLLDAATLTPLEFADDIPASAVAFSPDGKLLAVAVNQWNGDGPQRVDPQPLRLYQMPEGTLADRQLGGFPHGAVVEYQLDFSGDGRRLAAEVVSGDGQQDQATTGELVMVWDLGHPAQPVFRAALPAIPLVELSPDGRRLYLALTGEDHDRPIRVYEVDSGRLVASARSDLLDEIGAFAADLSPDGSTFAVTTASKVILYDTATLEPRSTVLRGPAGDYLDQLEYSHDGSMLAAVTREGGIVVWDADTGSASGASPSPTRPGRSRSPPTTGPCSARAVACAPGT